MASHSSTSMYRKIQGLDDGPWFRLLTFVPIIGRPDEPIQVEVKPYRLAKSPPYEALSYCWGNSSQKVRITCNESTISITENLFLALQQLRSGTHPKAFWVDAICINQNDLREREYQVGLMREIYVTAQRVVVWLGQREDDTHLAFNFFERSPDESVAEYGEYGAPRSAISETVVKSFTMLRNRHSNHERSQKIAIEDDTCSTAISRDELAAVYRVLRKSWWQRVWVIQEFSIAKAVIFMCGDFLTSEQRLKRGYEVAMNATGATTEKRDLLDEGVLAERTFSDRASMFEVRARVQSGANLSLLSLLHQFRSFKATDPRDKVYSLLGLIESSTTRTAIPVNYNIGIEECYRRAAVAILSEKTASDLLNTWCGTPLQGNDAFPSWVPNWATNTELLYIPIIRNFGSTDFASGLEYSRPNFAASQAITKQPRIKNNSTISMSGFILDEITHVSEPCTTLSDLYYILPIQDHKVRILKSTSQDHNAPKYGVLASLPGYLWTYYFVWGCYYIGAWCDTLLNWEALALSAKAPDGDDQLSNFCSTLCGSCLPANQAVEHYRDLQYLLRRCRVVHSLRTYGLHRLGAVYWVLVGLSLASVTFLDRDYEYQAYKNPLVTQKSLMHHRRLGKTTKGFLALVPENTLVGDKIALLDAGRTPFVLRPRDSMWSLVGDSYVNGVMQGQAWDESKAQSMNII